MFNGYRVVTCMCVREHRLTVSGSGHICTLVWSILHITNSYKDQWEHISTNSCNHLYNLPQIHKKLKSTVPGQQCPVNDFLGIRELVLIQKAVIHDTLNSKRKYTLCYCRVDTNGLRTKKCLIWPKGKKSFF